MKQKYQNKLFELEVFDHDMDSVKQFRDLSKQLREAFENEGIKVSEIASVKKKSKNEWHIIDESKRDIKAYHLKWNYDEITEKEWIDISGDSPSGKSDSIWDYHAFSPEIDVREVFEDDLFSGENRKKLTTETQRKKWDFFFRPIKRKVGEYQRRKLKKAQEKFNTAKRDFWGSIILLVIASLPMIVGIWQNDLIRFLIIGILIILELLFRKWLSDIDIFALLHTMIRKRKWIRAYKDEIKNLEYQISKIIVPSSLRIVKWLEEEIHLLNEEARIKLSIHEATVLTPDSANPLNLRGISLFGDAIFQPDFKSKVSERLGKQKQKFFGYRTYKNGYIHSGWYMAFIFLTHKKSCISTLYYDFIQGQPIDRFNKQYYYEDLIGNSVNTYRVDDPFKKEDNKTVEVDAVEMSFMDGRIMAVSLKNKKTSKDIRERIKLQKSIRELEARSPIEDTEKLIAELILSDTNSNTNADIMIKHIRRKLDKVKIKAELN